MKILFVEDQITRNISRITRLFEKYLTKNARKQLRELEKDDYPPGPEEIKRIVETSNLIEIEYRFPEALQKIITCHERYSLFIVDRNLFEEECYDFEEIKAIDPSFSEEKYELYAEREGDYLLYHLVFKTDVLSKFYFMTAYSANDEIRGKNYIQTYIDHKKFSTDNFIEKGNEEDFDRLKSTIDNINILNLQLENRFYLQILRKNIDDKAAGFFLEILTTPNDSPKRIRDNLNRMRLIYENIMDVCAIKIPGMRAACGDVKGGDTIKWMINNNHIDSNILRNFLFSIRNICNTFGSHSDFHPNIVPLYDPTSDTVNALIYALKDVILWFGKKCS